MTTDDPNPPSDCPPVGATPGNAEKRLAFQRVLDAIRRSTFDFRTVGSLTKELGISEEQTRRELDELERRGLVRRPVVADAKYDDWYRDVQRGLTKQEKRARWRALVTFQRMRDDF